MSLLVTFAILMLALLMLACTFCMLARASTLLSTVVFALMSIVAVGLSLD